MGGVGLGFVILQSWGFAAWLVCNFHLSAKWLRGAVTQGCQEFEID